MFLCVLKFSTWRGKCLNWANICPRIRVEHQWEDICMFGVHFLCRNIVNTNPLEDQRIFTESKRNCRILRTFLHRGVSFQSLIVAIRNWQVKEIIKVVKHWRNCVQWKKTSYRPNSYLLSLLVIKAAEDSRSWVSCQKQMNQNALDPETNVVCSRFVGKSRECTRTSESRTNKAPRESCEQSEISKRRLVLTCYRVIKFSLRPRELQAQLLNFIERFKTATHDVLGMTNISGGASERASKPHLNWTVSIRKTASHRGLWNICCHLLQRSLGIGFGAHVSRCFQSKVSVSLWRFDMKKVLHRMGALIMAPELK